MQRKQVRFDGFGVPLVMLNVPMTKIRGENIPDVNYNKVEAELLKKVSRLDRPMTGNEIRFVCAFLRIMRSDFAQFCGVKESEVLRWEKRNNRFAKIHVGIELYLRLSILHFFKAKAREYNMVFQEVTKNNKIKNPDWKKMTAPKPFRIDVSSKSLRGK